MIHSTHIQIITKAFWSRPPEVGCELDRDDKMIERKLRDLVSRSTIPKWCRSLAESYGALYDQIHSDVVPYFHSGIFGLCQQSQWAFDVLALTLAQVKHFANIGGDVGLSILVHTNIAFFKSWNILSELDVLEYFDLWTRGHDHSPQIAYDRVSQLHAWRNRVPSHGVLNFSVPDRTLEFVAFFNQHSSKSLFWMFSGFLYLSLSIQICLADSKQ
ncbi:hypothetical protein Tco_0158006 [Tanacetum coccineum]